MLVQEELENFPLPTIHMSQTVLNQTRYPSVLLLVCQDKEQHRPDIHFFHCDEVEVSLGSNVTGLAQFASFIVCARLAGFVFCVIHKSKLLLLERQVRFQSCWWAVCLCVSFYIFCSVAQRYLLKGQPIIL